MKSNVGGIDRILRVVAGVLLIAASFRLKRDWVD